MDDKKEGKLLRKTLERVDALLAESRRLVSVKKVDKCDIQGGTVFI